MKRIGLFGGTFDPVHMGHLRTAWEVRQSFGLDQIHLIPAALPPHKQARALAPADDRLNMLRTATEKNPKFLVSDIELKRSGPSYTIDTVHHFKKGLEANDQLFFILGIDAFVEIDTWKAFEALFDHIEMIVMTRPGAGGAVPESLFKDLSTYIATKVDPGYRFNQASGVFEHPAKKAIRLFQVTPLEISSTHIRKLVKNGHSIRFLVPEMVAQYIKNKGLYA